MTAYADAGSFSVYIPFVIPQGFDATELFELLAAPALNTDPADDRDMTCDHLRR